MVDLQGKDRGNISLPPRLQSPDIYDPNFVDDEHVVPIINMQKAFYDMRIRHTENRIRRLENRNDELLETREETEASIAGVDVETGDRIASLKKQIFSETEKIEDTTRRIDAVAKIREEAEEIHAKNVDAANEKYEKTRAALISSIKALNAKINTLEDYKQIRTALREKLIFRDEKMKRNEEEVTQRREAIDRKFKIDREKLKNEMYSRLLALAGTFQIEISNAITIPVHRLLRKNVFMKNELMQIMNETLSRNEVCTKLRSLETVHRNSMLIDSRDKTKHLITVKIQRYLIDSLKKMHSAMKNRLAKLNKPQEFAQEKYDKLAESVRNELIASETRTRKLEVVLHHESVKLDSVKYRKNQTETRRKKYEEIIYDVKYAVACALKITETREDILKMSEIELISHLLNLINRGQSHIQCLVADSSETIPRPDDVYAKGDLGFEPEYVDLEDTRAPMKFEKSITSETESIDSTAVSNVPNVPLTASLQHGDDNEIEEMESQTSVSSAENSASSLASPVDESKKESIEDRDNISEAAATYEDEEIIIENDEQLNSETAETFDDKETIIENDEQLNSESEDNDDR